MTTTGFVLISMMRFRLAVVGLGRFELPTSPLSGVRSNQLSYRPITGGAMRDRTADLLNANQALSQLSYSPLNLFFLRFPQAQKKCVTDASTEFDEDKCVNT